jgi:hypothetical protein
MLEIQVKKKNKTSCGLNSSNLKPEEQATVGGFSPKLNFDFFFMPWPVFLKIGQSS